jgi:hypothetical protein
MNRKGFLSNLFKATVAAAVGSKLDLIIPTKAEETKPLVWYRTTDTATLKYIAGHASFSKQLLMNMPFLQATLPTMLMRDFNKIEDDEVYQTLMKAAS